MTNVFLFHQQCDKDVQQIISELKKHEENRIEKFKNELLAAYQTIFENPSIGQKIERDWSLHREEIRCVTLYHFSYGVVYKTFPQRKVIVLAIVYIDFYYKYRTALKSLS